MPVPISHTHAQFCLRGYPTEGLANRAEGHWHNEGSSASTLCLSGKGWGGGGGEEWQSGMAFRSHSYCLAVQGAVADVC